ncbi:acyltransferase [Piscinibacter gummiphilus]|uniref:Acyltransferase n=1 Tax=Piscinibacter gummiphilus TaxID=946333 RepID=A0ABZ0CS28_9BURK|nr:acyltransferase [Piscinibacter gummiphilus]WOB07311.1 acyltransferase [Piscinibacter gummiphilus]
MSANAETQRIPALDGWRAISILLVIIGHLVNYRYQSGPPSPIAAYLSVMGVKVFFVISGLLIAGLALKEEATTGTLSMKGFYRRRVYRILPAYFAYLATVLVFSLLGWIQQDAAGIGLAAVFVCNAPGLDCGWFVGHSWSLAYEEQFYLVFPLLFVLVPRHVKPRLFAAIHAFLAATPLLSLLLMPDTPEWAAYRVLASHFCCISAGVMLAHHRETLARLARHHALVSAAALVVVAGCIAVTSGHFGHLPYHLRNAIETLVLPVSIAWLVFRTTVHRGAVTAFLDWAPLRYIGKISFSLYLWQQIFTAAPATVTFSVLWLLPVAMFSYHFIEQPMVRLGRARSHPPELLRQSLAR